MQASEVKHSRKAVFVKAETDETCGELRAYEAHSEIGWDVTRLSQSSWPLEQAPLRGRCALQVRGCFSRNQTVKTALNKMCQGILTDAVSCAEVVTELTEQPGSKVNENGAVH